MGCQASSSNYQIIEGCTVDKRQMVEAKALPEILQNSTLKKTRVMPSLSKKLLQTSLAERGTSVKHAQNQKHQTVKKKSTKMKMNSQMVADIEKPLITFLEAQNYLSALNSYLHDASENSQFALKNRETESSEHVRANVMDMYNNLEKVRVQFEEFINLFFSMSEDTNVVLENIQVWGDKYDVMVKCIESYKLIIKLGGGAILVGIACMSIAMPELIPVAITTLVKKFGDWLTTLCTKKQKDLMEKKEKILKVRQDIVEARLQYKLEVLLQEFLSFVEVMDKLTTRIGSDEVDVEEVVEDLLMVLKIIEELKMQVIELQPIVEMVVSCVLDVAIPSKGKRS